MHDVSPAASHYPGHSSHRALCCGAQVGSIYFNANRLHLGEIDPVSCVAAGSRFYKEETDAAMKESVGLADLIRDWQPKHQVVIVHLDNLSPK